MKLQIVLLLSLVITACSDPSNIKIGVILPLTGYAVESGQNVYYGIELAKHELENQGYQFELIYQDSACDPKQAIQAYRQLQIAGVDYITGFVCSGALLAVAPLTESDQQLIVGSTTSSPEISKLNEYIYRVIPSDEYDALSQVNLIGDQDLALIYLNNDYGVGVKSIIEQEISPVIVETFSLGERDFRSILAKVKQKNVKTVSFIGYPENTISFLEQIKELEMNVTVIGSLATVTFELYARPDLTDNFYFGNFAYSDEFASLFQQTYGRLPDSYSQFGYDSLFTILYAHETGIENVAFNGASGTVEFDSNGDRKGLYASYYKIIEGKNVCILNC